MTLDDFSPFGTQEKVLEDIRFRRISASLRSYEVPQGRA